MRTSRLPGFAREEGRGGMERAREGGARAKSPIRPSLPPREGREGGRERGGRERSEGRRDGGRGGREGREGGKGGMAKEGGSEVWRGGRE